MNLIAGILVLSISIIIHELGHFLLGKWVGIKPKVFSFGYGKGILKKKIGDTTYQITAIPLGGYVQFYGDELSQRDKVKPGDFFYAKPLIRIIPVLGGPLFNLILGIFIFAIFNYIGTEKPSSRITVPTEIRYTDKESGQSKKVVSPAYKSGLRSGDKVVSINGEEINTYSDLKAAVVFASGDNISVNFIRDGKSRIVKVEPKVLNDGDYPVIGVQPFFHYKIVQAIAKGPAEKAGLQKNDQIISYDGRPIESLNDMIQYIQTKEGNELKLTVQRAAKKREISLQLDKSYKVSFKNLQRADGTSVKLPDQELFFSQTIATSINKGRLYLNDKKINSEKDFFQLVSNRQAAGKKYRLKIGESQYLTEIATRQINFAGASFAIAKIDSQTVRYGALAAVGMGFVDAYDFVVLNLRGIKKLFSGDLSVQENLSGPIRIAKMAGDVAEHGWGPLFLFLAQISVVLMIMNLLPIPVVDGGHIVFFLIEAAMGRPISLKVQEKIMGFGLVFLLSLGIYVIFNDILSLEFIRNLFHMLS